MSYIIYIDDDDYYPPTRIYHAISTLMNNPTFLIAGSSELLIYYNHLKEVWKFGSSGRYHSTAATHSRYGRCLRRLRCLAAPQQRLVAPLPRAPSWAADSATICPAVNAYDWPVLSRAI